MKIIIIVILVIITLGVGFYFLNRDSDDLVVDSNMRMITDAFLGSGSIICDYIDPGYENRDDENITVYIKGGKMRFFYEDKNEENEDIFTNIVLKENYYYVWNDDGGMKISIEKQDIFVPFGVEDGEAYVYSDDEFNLSCKKSSIDDSMFDIPNNIDFFDMEEMKEDFSFSDHDQSIDEDFPLDEEMIRNLQEMEGFEGFDMENFDIQDFLQ